MSAEPAPPEGGIEVPVVWVGVDDLPVHHVNQFVGTVNPQEIFLTLGTLVPPPIFGGTPEERLAQAKSIEFVQIRPTARVALTDEGLRAFIRILNETLANFQEQKAKGS